MAVGVIHDAHALGKNLRRCASQPMKAWLRPIWKAGLDTERAHLHGVMPVPANQSS